MYSTQSLLVLERFDVGPYSDVMRCVLQSHYGRHCLVRSKGKHDQFPFQPFSKLDVKHKPVTDIHKMLQRLYKEEHACVCTYMSRPRMSPRSVKSSKRSSIHKRYSSR